MLTDSKIKALQSETSFIRDPRIFGFIFFNFIFSLVWSVSILPLFTLCDNKCSEIPTSNSKFA